VRDGSAIVGADAGLPPLDQFPKPSRGLSAVVGLVELFVAVRITGISCVNAGIPTGAFFRSKDGRFLALTGTSGLFTLLGALWN
jgi:hypothetical protein